MAQTAEHDGSEQFNAPNENGLAQALFAEEKHLMASGAREPQDIACSRTKFDCTNKLEDCDARSAVTGDGSNASLDVESCNGSALFVLGGATTFVDRSGFMDTKPTKAADGENQANVLYDGADADMLTSVDLVKVNDDASVPVQATAKLWILASCNRVKDAWQWLIEIFCLYHRALIASLVVFLLLCGLGIWGVIAGAHAHVQQRKDDARSRAVDAATGFQIQLQQSFTPGLTFTLLVKQKPDVEYWIQNFNATARELLTRVPKGSLWNLQLQPFAQVMMIYPARESDASQTSPPRNLLADPTRRADIMTIIQNREPLVIGPVPLYDNSAGAFVRYPIYVSNVSSDETFGFRYFDINSTLANDNHPRNFSQLPASVRNCSICYNATSREKWWGLMTVLLNYNAVVNGEDAYLATLRNLGFHYALVRPTNATHESIIVQVGPTDLRGEDAVTVEVKVLNGIWLLRVSPSDGFEPSWRDPLIAAVAVISFVISFLLFMSAASFKRQVLLLQETVAANHNLAETTKRLEEEKERMDVLLVRQYELLRCLDANRSESKDSGGGTQASSRKAMMARIEDARRSLNVAKSSVEDPIQVFEVLGEGAFGKVQKGLWRGTVVAVKTMILPANMTGQEKREKMAVMEAAISSSLVHPNIVTTYTYFIRPYHEPLNSSVQQSGASTSRVGDGSDRIASKGTFGNSVVLDSTIHSYEVRLVLEFCDKGSLKDALDQHAFMQGGGFNLAAMLETAADVGKAMVHMHAANVLHADLKARNIMMKSSGTEGRGVIAKVADFGLSTRMEHQETHLSSCFQGTLTHMAPEVMLEGRMSKAADVYSFGILMWELFCAGDPFAGVPRAHMGHAITKECRRPKFPLFAPRGYVALATRCWDPDASLRPCFEDVLTELVRMREELGGETRPLQITPPAPITPRQSNDGMLRCVASGSGISVDEVAQPLPSGGGGGASGSNSLGCGSPSALYGSGIVLGGPSSGYDSGNGSVLLSLGASQPGASAGHRSRMKNLVAQRQLRKMGIRLGGGSGTCLALTLPALHEDTEHK